jgi:16S rRNA (guanine527-N7)-methyltransferase
VTEDEAKAWIGQRHGSGAVDRLACFADMLAAENDRQNLVAPSTLPSIWTRHIVDSAQLAEWGGDAGLWLDIGTGGGLPGFVLALLLDRPFCLVEPRRLRAAFLERCVAEFALSTRVIVEASRIEQVRTRAATISARAVSGLTSLFATARHCATAETIWVLPRGKSGLSDVQHVTMPASATFHVKPSATDPAAVIIVATGVGS